MDGVMAVPDGRDGKTGGPVRLAFAGTGSIAGWHARAASKQPGVALVAAVNHRMGSLDAFCLTHHIRRKYLDIDTMLGDGGVDGLVVCTPNYLHAPQTIAALAAGVSVMVEKPMALNAAEAQEMVRAGERSGAVLMVGHCYRFHKEVRWLRARIGHGDLGRVVRTKGYSSHVAWGPGGWFTERRFAGGGALADMGVHAIDTARFLLGDPKPVQVYARIGTYYGDYEVDDTAALLVTWKGGATSYVESGWWQPHADGVRGCCQVYGTLGYGQVFPTHLEMPHPEDQDAGASNPGFPTTHSPEAVEGMYSAQMAHFVECVRLRQRPVSDGLVGLTAVRVLDAAYESQRTGKAVDL